MEDNLILVDIDDREIGSASKERAHFEGLLHRAFSVFLFQGNKLLIQRRNVNKYHSGGLLTNSCCSHPRVGESFEVAIRRRLREELGIIKSMDLCLVGNILYHEQFPDGVTEFEKDSIFVGEYFGEINICEDEIENAFWIEIDKLKEDVLENPQKYTCWFIIALPMVLDYVHNHMVEYKSSNEKME